MKEATENREHGFLIAGEQRFSESKAEIRNPFDETMIGAVCLANADDTDEAIEKAHAAFQTTKNLPSWKRARVLLEIARQIENEKEDFARLIALEAGKPLRDARVEVSRAVNTFTIAAEESKRMGGEILSLDWSPGMENRTALVRRFPIGAVLGITPFNFPLNLVAHKVAPAIAAGNPIIIKPAPQTPFSALRLGEYVVSAGWTPEAMSVVPCENDVAGRMLADERIKKLTFTGSAAVGWQLKALANRKKVTLELGGNAAVIIHDDADVETAVKRTVAGGFGYSGQSCISVQRIFLHELIKEDFVHKLIEAVKRLKVGNPLDEATEVGSLINRQAAERIEAWIAEAKTAGAKVLTGGGRNGNLFEPTVLSDVASNVKLSCEEVFAPVVIVDSYSDFAEVVRRANNSRYGLQTGVFTNDLRRIHFAYQELETGAVVINDVPTFRAEQMPYGGVKDSGVGREGVRSAIEEMTELKLLALNLN